MMRLQPFVLGFLCLCLLDGDLFGATEGARQPGPSPAQPGRLPEGFSELGGERERLCAEKIGLTLPLITLPVGSLTLREITVHVERGYYTVLLPLKQPRGKMRQLYWGADSLEEITTFIELLQESKLAAVRAEAYAFELRKGGRGGLSEAEVNDCDPERVRTLLNACEECEILEWVFRGRE